MTKLLLAFVGVLLLAAQMVAADLSGRWTLTLDPDFSGNPSTVDCTFKQDGSKLTVDCGAAITGEVDGQTVTLRFQTGRDNSVTATLTGELDQAATTLTGTIERTTELGWTGSPRVNSHDRNPPAASAPRSSSPMARRRGMAHMH
jgi:opacity protein-like surface antigen